MNQQRRIIPYHEATLDKLDAGVLIAYPRSDAGEYSYFAVPSFLIIGAAKCGTRELITWLGIHPHVLAASKEVNFFDEVIDIEREWIRYVLGPHNQVSRNPAHAKTCTRHTCEKSPGYFWKRNRGIPVPALVNRMMPNGKFLVILRNPTDRAYSAYQMDKRGTALNPTTGNIGSFEHHIIKSGAVHPDVGCINIGYYAQHLQSWLDTFRREQILVLFMEDFRANPFAVMQKVLQFLELPEYDYQAHAERLDRGYWVLLGHPSKAYDAPYEPMSAKMRTLLDEHYTPWNRRLAELFPELVVPW